MKSSTSLIDELCEFELAKNKLNSDSLKSHATSKNNPLSDSLKNHATSKHDELLEIKLTDDALENHLSSYANATGLINMKSIHDTCLHKMKLSEEKSTEVATNMMSRAWHCGIPGVYYSLFSGVYGDFSPKKAFPLFLLAYDGGLYDDNGEFREDLFHILQNKYAIEDWDSEKLISKAKMKAFLENETKQAERLLKTAPWSYQQFARSDVEFNAFFDQAISRYIFNKETNQMEGYVNICTLKMWYIHAKIQMDNMSRETTPIPGEISSQAVTDALTAIL